jgi:hypothetical protein
MSIRVHLFWTPSPSTLVVKQTVVADILEPGNVSRRAEIPVAAERGGLVHLIVKEGSAVAWWVETLDKHGNVSVSEITPSRPTPAIPLLPPCI